MSLLQKNLILPLYCGNIYIIPLKKPFNPKQSEELWDVKSNSTWIWATSDLSAQSTGLIDIIEPNQFIGVGLFVNLDIT